MCGDPYAGFSGRHDLGCGPGDLIGPGQAGFFRALFAEHGVRRVHDCACGTGRHVALFQSLGCQVSGSDLSMSMLARARKKLRAAAPTGELLQADYRHLPIWSDGPFDAVVCLGAIGYMRGESEFLCAFRSMARVLRSGGILILTVALTDRQWRERPRFLLAGSTPELSRVFVIDYLERSARYHVLDIVHGAGTAELKVWSAELHVLLRDEQERLLRAAGFDCIDFFGGYDREPYDMGTSDRLITVARRSRGG